MMQLLNSEEGNVIALLAAAIFPTIGLIGGGIDLSRMYLAQTRLQAACDAGVLMGRKTMGLGGWNRGSRNNAENPNMMAVRMFDHNFNSGAYGSRTLQRSFEEIDGTVAGTASVTIPMAFMQVLNVPEKRISVACRAVMHTPNSDVMFVLDTTGSMLENMEGETVADNKLAGLKIAVKCFYEALAKRNIDDVTASQCGETTDPGNSNIGNVQLRFGFVPYAQNVNVGRLLPKDYIADRWSYQSRVPRLDPTSNNFAGWTYRQVEFDVSSLKSGQGDLYAQKVRLPLGNTRGELTDIDWKGCIEERQTFRATDTDPSNDWDPIPSAAYDMDIDSAPTNDPATKWGPLLYGAVWQRFTLNELGNPTGNRTLEDMFIARGNNVWVPKAGDECGQVATKLKVWTRNNLRDYVNSITAGGYTYHDIGLVWGARLMSPTGMFANEINNLEGKTIQRHMIFMTDGETDMENFSYSAFGVSWFDRRQSPLGIVPEKAYLMALVNARTAALCKAIKDKDITLWVVQYGDLSSAASARLRSCASPGKFVEAHNTTNLTAKFKNIASEISELRLTE